MADENVGARHSRHIENKGARVADENVGTRPSRHNENKGASSSMFTSLNERDAEALRAHERQGFLTHKERVALASESRRLDRKNRNLKPWWDKSNTAEYEPLNLDEPGVKSPQSPFNQSVDMSVESSPQSKFNQSVDMSVESPFESPVVSPQQYPRNTGTFIKSNHKDGSMFEGPFKFKNPKDKYKFDPEEGESFRPFGGKTKRVKRRKTKRRKSIRLHR
jgi:hypothetical protein